MIRLAALTLAAPLALAGAPAAAQDAALPTWMVGTWLSCAEGVQVAETMLGDGRGALLGSNLTVGPRTGYEFYRIAPNGQGSISFYAQPSGQPPVEFAVKSREGERVEFENAAHDFPQRVIYWREGSGLGARIEGTWQGKAESEDWHFVPALPGQSCNFGATAGAIAAAERAFAADGAEHGFRWAFRRWHAPGALVLQPGPQPAEITLARAAGDGTTGLAWKPAFAGAALSGDLGFTTGPYRLGGDEQVAGHYFTVWQLQPGGRWQWLFDGGTDVADPRPYSSSDETALLPVASRGAGSAEAALAAVAALEDAAGFAVGPGLRADSHLNRSGAAPAIGAAAAELAGKDPALAYRALLRRASAAGDMVFSLGEARAGADGEPGTYARIWQLGADGWRVVFDEIVPPPE